MLFIVTSPTTRGMYVSVEWSLQPMYRHYILTLYLFDLCSRFVRVRKWRVLGGLSLNYRWCRSARGGYKYTATVVGRVGKQWGRQPSGWWGPRAGLSTGCVFCTIIMANGVGWLGNNVRRASRWPNTIHVHAPVALQRLIIYKKKSCIYWHDNKGLSQKMSYYLQPRYDSMAFDPLLYHCYY